MAQRQRRNSWLESGRSAFARLALAMGAGGALVACGLQGKLDDMHDATLELRDKTGQMQRQTADMGATTEELRDVTRSTYGDLRPDNALKEREEQRRSLRAAESPAEKLSHAAKYHMAFEVQLWSPRDPGGLAQREQLAAVAAREFYREIQSLIPRSPYVFPEPLANPDDGPEANRLASANALAATMHIIFDKQQDLLNLNPRLAEINMLKMTEEALRARVEIEAGRKSRSDFPKYVDEILNFEAQAIYMLQARHNYVAVIALGNVSNLPWAGKIELATMACGFLARPWPARFDRLNDVQLDAFTDYLREARKNREFLASIGVVPAIDLTLRTFFRRMQAPAYIGSLTEEPPAAEVPSPSGAQAETVDPAAVRMVARVRAERAFVREAATIAALTSVREGYTWSGLARLFARDGGTSTGRGSLSQWLLNRACAR